MRFGVSARMTNSFETLTSLQGDSSPPPDPRGRAHLRKKQDASQAQRKAHPEAMPRKSGQKQKHARPGRDMSSGRDSKRQPDVRKRRHRSLPQWVSPAPTVIIEDSGVVMTAVTELMKSSRIAVDCEGVALSRTGRLTLMQVASERAVYIFDIAVGGRALFDAGLRLLLESPKCIKVMHDCRHDCDALKHQFDVHLAPVADTQISFAVLRDVRQLPMGLPVSLKTLLRKFCGVSEDDIAVKDSIKAEMRGNANFWLERPISAAGLAYARFDVIYLIHLAKVLAIHITDADASGWDRVLKDSAAYSALFRDDSDGPRKENARWAVMVTESRGRQAAMDRRKARQSLQASDPMMTFSFKKELIILAFK